MSLSLHWRPAPSPGSVLPTDLKKALEKRFHLVERSDNAVPVMIDRREVDYLMGLRDAGIIGADELLAAVQQNGRVELSLA